MFSMCFKCKNQNEFNEMYSCADPEGRGQGVWTTPGKLQLAIGFLRNAGTDTPREAIEPLEGSPYGPL